MTYFQSFLMGLVQGLGEFLPISSSAHLVILPWFVKFEDPGLAFDVALHLGTLFAVVAYFWKDWWQILGGTVRYAQCAVRNAQIQDDKAHSAQRTAQGEFHILIALIIATIPAAIAGVFLDEWAETTLRQPLLVAFNMIVLGAILLAVDKLRGHINILEKMTFTTAFVIGLSQCLALFPGVSRSGITITTALLLGLTRTESARFSFLMSTPIIFGACLFKYKYFGQALTDPKALIGIATSALFGFLSIKYLMKLVQHYSYAIFSYYRFVFGAVVIALYFVRNL